MSPAPPLEGRGFALAAARRRHQGHPHARGQIPPAPGGKTRHHGSVSTTRKQERGTGGGAQHPPQIPLPFDAAYAAIHARDTRFDGAFYTAVLTTGIYCRPSCPAPTPKPGNVRFVRSAAQAQAQGFRACLRCFPEALPGSAQWDPHATLAGRALALIEDGALDEAPIEQLASSLGTSARTLHRVLVEETGAPPVAHARAHRARTAFRLLASTDLNTADVAFSAGFGSVRQFNDTVKELFERTPSQLREAARRSPRVTAPGTPVSLSARLPSNGPVDSDGLLAWFAARTVNGVDEVTGGNYRVALRLPRGAGTLSIGLDGQASLRARLLLDDAADLPSAVATARRLFDLDADSRSIDAALGRLPWLRDSVAARPGARIPGEPTLTESLLRAICTQQVSVAAGRAQLQRLAAAVHGEPGEQGKQGEQGAETGHAASGTEGEAGRDAATGTDPHATTANERALLPFPSAAQALETLPEWFRGPAARRATLDSVLTLLAQRGDPAAGDEAAAALDEVAGLKGIGPWTLGYSRLRTLGDPDVDLSGDGALLSRAKARGLATDKKTLAELLNQARPWRSYAALHLWG